MRIKVGRFLLLAALLASNGVWAGAGSSSTLGGPGSGLGTTSAISGGSGGVLLLEKINRHAIKSTSLVRQLLAQNGAPGVATSK